MREGDRQHQATAASAWAPFGHRAFAVLWVASVVSNIGTTMYSAASGWLMTTLNPEPLTVSLVQVASSLPMFLFAMPGGALADILDKRRLLLAAVAVSTIFSAMLALLVWRGGITPAILLTFTFLIGAAAAISSPPWQAIVPMLVPRTTLHAAIAANGIGFNMSRAVGPALGGLLTTAAGIASPFALNAASNLAVLAALLWWRAPAMDTGHLRAERFGSAIRLGLHHAAYNLNLRATLLRTIAFFFFASAYWALLPLVARNQLAGGPTLYGLLLGAIGVGAVAGAFVIPLMKRRLGPDWSMAIGTGGTAAAMLLFALASDNALALAASLVAGVSWIVSVSNLNVSAQMSLPEWVRGRGLAVYTTTLFGALTVGSFVWGKVAGLVGLPLCHVAAAAGAVIALGLSWRWHLQSGEGIDLTPSLHWPAPIVDAGLAQEGGPVLVTVEYRIAAADRAPFLAALEKLSFERRRDGAFGWGVFEDSTMSGRFLETFYLDSWLEHMRQHQRVTKTDQALQEIVNRFQAQAAPKVTHFTAPAQRIKPGR